jgi:hypothetical protein
MKSGLRGIAGRLIGVNLCALKGHEVNVDSDNE